MKVLEVDREGPGLKTEEKDSFRDQIRASPMARTDTIRKGERRRLAVMASGRGSDFEAIVEASEKGDVGYDVALLICNNPSAFVIERAKQHSIPYVVIDHRERDRREFEMEVDEVLRETGVDLVALAGFMRILSPEFVSKWEDRIINIHPSLLPSFPGTHAHRDALDYGVKVTGLTIHFVDEKMDHGPIIFQYPVEVRDGDTEETLSLRVLEKEHYWYPRVLDLVINGKVKRKGRKVEIIQ